MRPRQILRKAGMPEDEIEKVSEKYKANFPEWRLDSFPGMLGENLIIIGIRYSK
jgi:hypothetical protein